MMLRVISANVNGIRAAARKGFFDWLVQQEADVVCVQETKAHMQHIQEPLYYPEGYHCYYQDAEKKGYSGVGIYCRQKPQQITTGLGWSHADTEGRYIQADFANCSVASIYIPSGSSAEARQVIKYDFMERYLPILQETTHRQYPLIICGDWNIAHKKIDIKNWRGNQKNSGFLPEERAWLDRVFDEVGLVDAFRVINQEEEQYTWWSNRGRAWEKNVGWRIDYQVVTPQLKPLVKAVSIYKDQRFSDHAPLIIDYAFDLS